MPVTRSTSKVPTPLASAASPALTAAVEQPAAAIDQDWIRQARAAGVDGQAAFERAELGKEFFHSAAPAPLSRRVKCQDTLLPLEL